MLSLPDVCCRILQEAGDAIILADSEGIIRLWNRGAEEMFGYREAEALGQSLNLIIPPDLQSRHWQGYRRVMESGATRYGSQLLAVPGRHRDGRTLSLEFTVTLVQDGHGRTMGAAAIIREVTARWQRERELRARLAHLEAACGPTPTPAG
ncbi:MAG: PAS domain S-box protein [Syntrophobacterales bacterium]|nr:PAS domain S-box protein [Syntrophobacterales bacterium]